MHEYGINYMNSMGVAVKFGINTTLVALKMKISPHDFLPHTEPTEHHDVVLLQQT